MPPPKHKLGPLLAKLAKKHSQIRTSRTQYSTKSTTPTPLARQKSETTIQHTSNNNSISQPAIMTTISAELMTTETFNLGEAAVGVADIFEGTNPPVEFLKKRAGDMLRANPWLAGRLALARIEPVRIIYAFSFEAPQARDRRDERHTQEAAEARHVVYRLCSNLQLCRFEYL